MSKRTDIVKSVLATLPRGRVAEYHLYFERLKPKTDADLFRRGLFALASVHTTWRNNIALYNELKNFEEWMGNQAELRQRIVNSRAGLVNNRTRFITAYAEDFWIKPSEFRKQDDEEWETYRQRIQTRTKGLGIAKSAFFVELAYLNEANTVCADTHFLQIFGNGPSRIRKNRIGEPEIARMCTDWCSVCAAEGIPPVTARWLHWDIKQEKQDSSYWAHVLEETST